MINDVNVGGPNDTGIETIAADDDDDGGNAGDVGCEDDAGD